MSGADHDRRLMAQVASGDHDAFDDLMREHQDRIFAVCLRIMAEREAALDATQDTFLTVYRKASQYRGAAAVSTWMYRVAVNTCYDLLRKAKRRPSEPLPDHLDPADPAGQDPFTSVELRPDIEAALAKIPPEFRAAVVLSDIHGLGLPEVSEVLDIPLGTVKSRVFRGRRLLAELLRDRPSEESAEGGNRPSPSRRPRNDSDA